MVPRSVDALFAFYAAQENLGEPWGNNANWITRAFGLGDVAWCVETAWTARIAAGFNNSGQVLDFGSPDSPPAWGRNPLPHPAGVGFGSTYSQGSAYVWEEQRFAEAAGRWTTNFDEARPGDSVCVNHNGRGGARTPNSHLATFIAWAPDDTALTWNGNVGNKLCKARWSKNVIEGFCHPDFTVGSGPDPSKEDEMFSRSPAPAACLIAAHSGLLVEVDGFPPVSNDRPIVQSPGDGMLDQRWIPWGHPDGSMSLVGRNPDGSHYAIDVPNGDAHPEARLRTWDFNASAAQKFVFDQISPYLTNIRHAASGLLIDVIGGETARNAGNPLQLYTPNGARNQQFVVAPTI